MKPYHTAINWFYLVCNISHQITIVNSKANNICPESLERVMEASNTKPDQTVLNRFYMSLDARKLDFVACKQHRHRPACTSTQSDQHLY